MTEPVEVDVDPAPRSSVLCAAWATPADVPERYRATRSNEQWAEHLMHASEILWALSGRRWYGGTCTETAEFQETSGCWDQRVDTGGGNFWYVPARSWATQGSDAIKLPRSPVTAVTSMTVDGEPFTGYKLEPAGGLLYRTDGCGWQSCYRGVITATYTYGEAPPEAGVQAAVALAVEIALAAAGSSDCSLPERVQSITRQGISMTMLDPMDFLPEGRTGIYIVDLWLTSVNPNNRAQRGRVWSPDVPRLRRLI